MDSLADLRRRHEALRAEGLELDMRRGQPSDADFDLSNPLLTAVTAASTTSEEGFDVRNYPGGPMGLLEMRRIVAELWGVEASQVMVRNNASLELMAQVLMWAGLRGLPASSAPWTAGAGAPRVVVTVPGYDRHFTLLEALGYELEPVPMTPDGPDPDAVARAVADPAVKAMLFVPNYSNPSGEVLSAEVAERLVSIDAAAPDFTILADDAYRVHHLVDDPPAMVDLLGMARRLGRPERVAVFGSTSKITFAGGGLGFVMANDALMAWLRRSLGTTSIGPNKVEQLRHARFLTSYPGGVPGLMRDHAARIAPKFGAVQTALEDALGGRELATWSDPVGGYFVTLWTDRPVAGRVVELAADVGVKLTPAGATHPGGVDPDDRTLRLAPTRPPLAQVERAMAVVAHCVMLASAEFDAGEGKDAGGRGGGGAASPSAEGSRP